ncbi:MAG TPA: peptide ABC transporter substrate-binding protein [Candidatus Acidoferrum sp.]|nr:peptide ABC transporter substrate-binding protein [Candidatus Acidoferrum sp.]
MSDFEDIPTLTRRSALHGKLRSIEAASLKHAHRFLVRRWKNLEETRKRIICWVLFVLLLSGLAAFQSMQTRAAYLIDGPSHGGTYSEGVLGAINSLNPIFAGTQAELSASHLLFAGLVTHDDQGDVVGDLAQNWTSDAQGKTYTVTLRPNARWSDGVPITADDVLYTFNVIQNADTRSPLYNSWSNISVEKIDPRTVRFVLPTAYAPFMQSLTVGILPLHVLGKLQPAALRNYQYNRDPTVTSGPFRFKDMRALDDLNSHYLVDMAANADYFGGAPNLDSFQLYTYADQDHLVDAYKSEEVAAVAGLDSAHVAEINPKQATSIASPLYDGVYVFLNLDQPVLQDIRVREALALATDQKAILQALGSKAQPTIGPLLPGQLGYDPGLHQAAPNLAAANQLLTDDGWALNAQGKRAKNGQLLSLQLITADSGDYPTVAQVLMSQWGKLGVSFGNNSQLVRPEDIQQNFIESRSYSVLIYDLALGSDPDVYAYWDSSQASPQGFNLSQYHSARVDAELESARISLNPALRAAKYRAFTQQWLADVPAIALYQPNFNYVQTKSVTSFTPYPLIQATDRYYNVIHWAAGMQKVVPTL